VTHTTSRDGALICAKLGIGTVVGTTMGRTVAVAGEDVAGAGVGLAATGDAVLEGVAEVTGGLWLGTNDPVGRHAPTTSPTTIAREELAARRELTHLP